MKTFLLFISLLFCLVTLGQPNTSNKDTTVNNLFHPEGYKTSELGTIPKYIKKGNGEQVMILVPGLSFDASVFKDFMEANKKNYTMYAITIPGFGNTPAPPMPDTSVSYGEQTWNKGVVDGLVKLIQKKGLKKPIIVGHFLLGVQIAVRLAVDHPDMVGGLILLGGSAKFVGLRDGKLFDLPLEKLIQGADKYFGPIWFKHMRKKFYDDNNFKPEIYSLDSSKGVALWNRVASVPLQVAIRYGTEYFASDVRADFNKIKCPVLVLRALFNDNVWQKPMNVFLKPQFIDSWENASSVNNLIKIKDVHNAAAFIWKDKPDEVYKEIKSFVHSIN